MTDKQTIFIAGFKERQKKAFNTMLETYKHFDPFWAGDDIIIESNKALKQQRNCNGQP